MTDRRKFPVESIINRVARDFYATVPPEVQDAVWCGHIVLRPAGSCETCDLSRACVRRAARAERWLRVKASDIN